MELGKNSPEQLRDNRLCSRSEYLAGIPHRIHPANLARQERYSLRVLRDEGPPEQAALDCETIVTGVEYQQQEQCYSVQFFIKRKQVVVERELTFNPAGFAVIGEEGSFQEIGYFAGDSELSDWNRELSQLLDNVKPREPALS